MRLLNQIVAPGSGNHLTVLCTVKLRQFSDRCTVATKFIRMDRDWNLIRDQKRGKERLRRLCITMFLQKNVQHSAVLVDCTP